MDYLPITINKAYLLNEQEHEYLNNYTYTVSDIQETPSRNVMPKINGNNIKLKYYETWIPLELDGEIPANRHKYDELNFKIYQPYISPTTSWRGYASVRIYPNYDQAHNTVNHIAVTTYDNGSQSIDTVASSTPSGSGLRFGYVLTAKRIVTQLQDDLSRASFYQSAPPENLLEVTFRPIQGDTYQGDWYNPHFIGGNFTQYIIIDTESLGTLVNNKIVTQNIERSVIT